MGNPSAKGRDTEIANILEYFLDEHKDEISPDMFRQLDSLAGEIDAKAENLETEIKELHEENNELNKRISELEEK